MILPKKQLSLNESLFGFGAFLLKRSYYKDAYDRKMYPVKFSFDQFVMALDYLFIIGAIKENEGGMLSYETA